MEKDFINKINRKKKNREKHNRVKHIQIENFCRWNLQWTKLKDQPKMKIFVLKQYSEVLIGILIL